MAWGAGQGCRWLATQCNDADVWRDNYAACDRAALFGCEYDRSAIGLCLPKNYGTACLPSYFRNLVDVSCSTSGAPEEFDYCALPRRITPAMGAQCRLPGVPSAPTMLTATAGQRFGEVGSRCLLASLLVNATAASLDLEPGCYRTLCSDAGDLSVELALNDGATRVVDCPRAGGRVSVDGLKGVLALRLLARLCHCKFNRLVAQARCFVRRPTSSAACRVVAPASASPVVVSATKALWALRAIAVTPRRPIAR